MYNFNTWLDQWVRERQRPQAALMLETALAEHSRYPDDPVRRNGASQTHGASQANKAGQAHGDSQANKAGPAHGDSPANKAGQTRRIHAVREVRETPSRRIRDFAYFWLQYRSHPELQDLSLAAARCLLGAREERFSGFLTIREDLPAQWYLELPFLRRCWRLLWVLDEYEQGDYSGEPPLVEMISHADRSADRSYGGLSFSWSLLRELDMSPDSARVNMRALLIFLIEAGMLEPGGGRFLSERARALVAAGSPGSFYKALCIRTFNRCLWDREDGLPPLHSIQLNGFYLLYVLHSLSIDPEGPRGASPLQLAQKLDGLNTLLRIPPESSFWVRDTHLVARAIQHRLLGRIGRILGLVETVPYLARSAPDEREELYRPTVFAQRVFLWNL